MHRALIWLALIGCYSPTYREGLLCAAGPDPCPPGQSCFSGTCYLSSRDGAPDDTVDTAIDSGPCVPGTGTFCLETTPVTGNLYSVWGSAAERIWVAGDEGVWSYNQGTWTKEPVSGIFDSVHGFANDAVWVISTSGAILFWNGTTWSVSSTGSAEMRALLALSRTEAWAAGATMRAWHFTGTVPWPTASAGLIGSAHSLAARSATEVYLGGVDTLTGTGTLFRYESSTLSWTRISTNPAVPMTFEAMWHSPTSLYIAATDNDSGEVFRFTTAGQIVSEAVTDAELHAIHGTSAADVWAVGSSGTVLSRRLGGNWDPVTGSGTGILRGVAAFPNRVWVVGDNARVYSLIR